MIALTPEELVLVTTTTEKPADQALGTDDATGPAAGDVVAYDGSAGATSRRGVGGDASMVPGGRLRVLHASDVVGEVFTTDDVLARDARAAGLDLAEEGAERARGTAGQDLDVVAEAHLTSPAARFRWSSKEGGRARAHRGR